MRLNTPKTHTPARAAHRAPRARAGFTLVELMVSLVILGLIMTVIFSLFSTTSDGLKEADSLVDTMDRARFAIERVSSDMKSAGAFATPDSTRDPWVIRNSGGTPLCVAGVAGYSGWQNSVTLLTGNKASAHNAGAAAPGVSYDGFIIMSAREFPQTFEASNFGPNSAVIRGHARGVVKLLANSPFYMDPTLPSEVTNAATANTAFTDSLEGRLLRVADRDGNLQFSGIAQAEWSGTTSGDTTESINLALATPLQFRRSAADGSAYQKGLDPRTVSEEDIGYGTALIDAYWYRVERSPLDPQNYRLVRERLNAAAIAPQLCQPNNITEATLVAASEEQIVITDRVADFQVWFDCATDTLGNLTNATWQSEWASPDGGGNCMDVTTPNFGAARMAHIRLSLHTRDERQDVPDEREALYALDEDGNYEGALRYFNIYPDSPGAARVVTVQADVALNTFAMRNIR